MDLSNIKLKNYYTKKFFGKSTQYIISLSLDKETDVHR